MYSLHPSRDVQSDNLSTVVLLPLKFGYVIEEVDSECEPYIVGDVKEPPISSK